jgi:hypothetical protein
MIDKIGRIKPLIVSADMLGATLLVNAVQAQYLNPNNGNQLRSMVAMNFGFSLFYTPLGIISWVTSPSIAAQHDHHNTLLQVYPTEIFPVEVRALVNAITTFTN